MGADSWRNTGGAARSPREKSAALCGALLVLGAVACKQSNPTPPALDGGGDAPAGHKGDARAPDTAQEPNACATGTPSKSKGKAESCTCDGECQSGFCVDGICCTTTCGQTCKACNLPSSLGDCAFVPSGVRPNDPLVCAASTPATCGHDGTCDGKGACRLYLKGTECKAGTCDGDGVTSILTCDGNGQCANAISQTCPPYSCDPATDHCAFNCTTNAQCAVGQQCVAGSCGQSSNGAACKTDAGCSSGFCVDGVCCNVACSGACVSCNQTGSVGHCTFIPAGQPDPTCQATDPTTCGNTGLCDGFGSCTLYPENTVCGPSSCSGLVENTPRTCDGQGTCRDPQLVDCSPFLCANSVCENICTSDIQCQTGHQCVLQSKNGVSLGVCGKRKNGQLCADSTECESAQCVDGVCCESSCAGACQSCNLPGSPGQCLNVASGAPDPRNTCNDRGVASCSTNGVCDGNGACQTYPAGIDCGPESCVSGVHTPPSTCNAAGQCVASRSLACNPYLCNGDVCYASCTNDKQCVSGKFCVNSSCGPKQSGQPCSSAAECQSGFCAQGVCCENACTQACMACNLTATPGRCMAVADKAPDPQGKCAVTTSPSCGTTGTCISGACAYYDNGTNCRAAVCAAAASATPTSKCDGKGTCVTPTNQDCGDFVCSAGACDTTCTKDTDCVAPNTCSVNNSCGLKVNGAACTAAIQCQSGFCTEGVCCNTACADATSGGLCMTCKGTSTSQAGTCSFVDSGAADPRARCSKSTASSGDCSNDGTCNGAGACRPWSSSTGCRLESCTNSSTAGTHTPAAKCDGAGKCPAANSANCGSYFCNPSSPTCLVNCTADHDCTNGLSCVLSHCGTKLGPGEDCKADSDCAAGVCSAEGVCCDAKCAGGCQSCKLSGTFGVCTNLAASSTPRDATTTTTGTSTTCRPAAAAGACGNTGQCDGHNGCEQRTTCNPAITSCPSDAHSQYNTVGQCTYTSTSSTCNLQTQTCGTAGYLCVASGSTYVCGNSTTGCTSDSGCDTANGYSCISKKCSKRAQNAACTASNQCSTGNCVPSAASSGASSICCGTGCPANGAPKCGTNNQCATGGAACVDPFGQNCGAAVCLATTPPSVTPAATCGHDGTCPVPAAVSCGGFNCSGGACLNTCTVGTNAGCTSGYYCSGGTSCLPQKVAGTSCSAAAECQSGNCVASATGSGSICCATSCPASGSPKCGTNNQCATGGAACVDPFGQNCAAAVCLPTTPPSLTPAATCGHTGTCSTPQTASCNGFNCSAGSCVTVCTVGSNAGCSSGYYCSGGTSCLLQKTVGASCSAAAQCQSGNCVAGAAGGSICCATGCPANGALKCGTNSQCAAGGAACVDPFGQNCAAAVCLATSPPSLTPAATCGHDGTCPAPPTVSCAGFNCSGGSCLSTCTVGTNAGCAAGYYCSGGNSCLLQKTSGLACGSPAECQSGNCVASAAGGSSICCATSCPANSALKCGNNNQCLAGGAGCADPFGQTCAISVCVGSTPPSVTPAATCGHDGSCPIPAAVPCNGFSCSAGSCATTCTVGTNAGCASGDYCSGGTSCLPQKIASANCSASAECQSGNCVASAAGGSSICCATSCPASGTTKCGNNDQCVAAGTGCVDPFGQTCSAATCSSTTPPSAISAGTCGHTGACAVTAVSCKGFTCSAGNCATSCTPGTNSGCIQGYYCDGAACQEGSCASGPGCASGYVCSSEGTCIVTGSKADGATCSSGAECVNANCVSTGGSKICCHTPCADAPCASTAFCASGGASCGTHANQACGVCVDSAHASVGTCDGLGGCVQASSTSCVAGYLCVTRLNACVSPGSCVSDADCDTVSGYHCSAGNCTTGP